MAARRYLASRTLDDILVDRNEISDAVRDEVKEGAESYGVSILLADVKDLVFPGNLREIMNQVLETERRAEAKLIEARKEAEASLLLNKAASDARLADLEAQKKEMTLRAEQEKAELRRELDGQIEQAKALASNPEMLKLRQLEVLQELAKEGNGRFVIGLDAGDLSSALKN